jgi:colanic acid/amylovoran biosynthesis glycosyltransferase
VSSTLADSSGLGVIFNCPTWLPQTQNWIYTQARYLPAAMSPAIVCWNTANLDQFRVDNLFSYYELPLFKRWGMLFTALPALGFSFSRSGALLAAVARDNHAKVVHSHFGHHGARYARAVAKLGIKHVVTFYGADITALPTSDPRWGDRYRAMFAQVDKVLCEGPHMAATARKLGCPDAKIEVHHLGVQLQCLPYRPRRWDPGSPLRVLIAASFREKKGIPDALQALSECRHSFPLEVTIIGDANKSPKSLAEKERILSAVDRCALTCKVTLTGYMPYSAFLDQAYQHHIFLSPSITASDGDTEGGAPVSIIEMAATGMPVVSTRHADIPEVIEHDVGGLLAAEGDVEGLVSHLSWLIEHPEKWDGMASAARRRVELDFDAARQGTKLAEIYLRLLDAGAEHAEAGGDQNSLSVVPIVSSGARRRSI